MLPNFSSHPRFRGWFGVLCHLALLADATQGGTLWVVFATAGLVILSLLDLSQVSSAHPYSTTSRTRAQVEKSRSGPASSGPVTG